MGFEARDRYGSHGEVSGIAENRRSGVSLRKLIVDLFTHPSGSLSGCGLDFPFVQNLHNKHASINTFLRHLTRDFLECLVTKPYLVSRGFAVGKQVDGLEFELRPLNFWV